MANAIIADNRLVTASGAVVSGSSVVAGYPVSNVQVFQPGDSYRTDLVSAGSVQASPPGQAVIDTIGVLYTNLTAHPNMLRQSNEFDTTWVATNVVVSQNSAQSQDGTQYSWELADDATADVHHLSQTVTFPAGVPLEQIESSYITARFLVRRETGTLDCRIRIRPLAVGTEYVECAFDLGAGTAAAPSDPQSVWANESATITARGSSWYEVTLTAEADAAGTGEDEYQIRLYLESGGNISYSGSSDSLLAQAAQCENASAATGWVSTTTDSASFWKHLWETWTPCSPTDNRHLPYYHLIATGAAASTDTVTCNFFDPNNADSYIEIGNYVLAEAFQPARNIDSGWSVGYSEEGGQNRSLGGQLYRPVNKRYRRLKMTHDWLTEAEAMAEALEIDRRVGRSEGVLAINNPGGTYEQETAIWGLQDTINEVMHKHYSTSAGGNIYRKGWHIVEALP